MKKTVVELDDRPGSYYVSALHDGQYFPMLGPLPSHQEALDKVEIVRLFAGQVDPRAVFTAFGTVRVEETEGQALPQGRLNEYWPLEYVPGTQLVRSVAQVPEEVQEAICPSGG